MTETNYIFHHGIKGQKWGVRRFQNKDGSLTAAGKKRVSKQYKKNVEIANKRFIRTAKSDIGIKAYNKSADYMNEGGIARFNEQQRSKYGENYAKRDGYVKDYEDQFNKLFRENFNKGVNEFWDNNPNYQKGKALVDKYRMREWDEFVKKNEADVKEARNWRPNVKDLL